MTDAHRSLDIEILIAEEADPKNRALLIILNSIDHSLRANVAQTHEMRADLQGVADKLEVHQRKFDDHVVEATKAEGKWSGAKMMFPVVATTCATLLSLTTYVASTSLNKLHALEETDRTHYEAHLELKKASTMQAERFAYISERLAAVEHYICQKERRC